MLPFICPPAQPFFHLDLKHSCNLPDGVVMSSLLRHNSSVPPTLSRITLVRHALTMNISLIVPLLHHLPLLLLMELKLLSLDFWSPHRPLRCWAHSLPINLICCLRKNAVKSPNLLCPAFISTACGTRTPHLGSPNKACISLWLGLPSASSSGWYLWLYIPPMLTPNLCLWLEVSPLFT